MLLWYRELVQGRQTANARASLFKAMERGIAALPAVRAPQTDITLYCDANEQPEGGGIPLHSSSRRVLPVEQAERTLASFGEKRYMYKYLISSHVGAHDCLSYEQICRLLPLVEVPDFGKLNARQARDKLIERWVCTHNSSLFVSH